MGRIVNPLAVAFFQLSNEIHRLRINLTHLSNVAIFSPGMMLDITQVVARFCDELTTLMDDCVSQLNPDNSDEPN